MLVVISEVQRRAAPVLAPGSDAVIQSQTGSGKTLACLVPLLAKLDYPPEVYPDDLKGVQLVVVVPTRELGTQMALLMYRLYGGNTKLGEPGHEANIYTYTGPKGIKVI